MQDTTALEQQIMQAHARFTTAVAGLDDAALTSTPAVGDWTARQVASHLADWIDEMLAAAETALSGGQVEAVADGDAFNRAGVARHADESWAETQLRLDNAISATIACVSRLEPGQLETPTAFPWGGSGTLERLLGGVAGHHNAHADELADWRAARG